MFGALGAALIHVAGISAQGAPTGPPAPAGAPIPPPPNAEVPSWVIRYASGQENAVRQCQIQLAQEQDRADKLQKELEASKAAKAPDTKKP